MGRLEGEEAHHDNRGRIVDLLTAVNIDAVTYLTLVPGAVRGNHFHKETIQWTLVVDGVIAYAERLEGQETKTFVGRRGDLFVSEPNAVHAIKAKSASAIVVFTSGPRAGDSYESDTFRVEPPILW